MSDDEEIPVPKWCKAQLAGLERQIADEEAFAALVAMFEFVYGRPPICDTEAFEWGAKNTDANLIAMGFEDRAGFQYNFDLCLMVEHGPRAKDAIN
jgi:hypothetical protein